MARVLLIDDNPSVLQSLDFFLEYEGYDVLQASNGTSGLRILDEEKVDIVMLDVEMPGISGIAVCKNIRNNPALNGLPVIIITGRGTRQVMAEARAAGASAVMGKPFELDGLKKKILELLSPIPEVPSEPPPPADDET